jgi:hypothetical protein
MALSIPIRSRLKGNRKTIVTRGVAIRWTTLASRKRRSHLIRGRRHIRRRSSIRNMRTTRIVERKRRQLRGEWRIGRKRRGTRWGGGWRWGRWSIGKDGMRRRINRHRGWCVGKQNKRYVLHREGQVGGTWVEGSRLIKLDVTRNAHPMANEVPTSIALVLITVVTVAKKDTLNRLSGQFGALARGQKNIANATKRAESRIIRGASKQTL